MGKHRTLGSSEFIDLLVSPAVTSAAAARRWRNISRWSALVTNGQALKYFRQQLGQGSIQIPADVYSRWLADTNRPAVDQLDETPIRDPDATEDEEADPEIGPSILEPAT